ncbi:MAG: MerR family DNA-binding transcriptional regulator [Pseudomonadota bacterium]
MVKSKHKPKAKPAPQVYSISDLAREFDVTTRTLRFYEEKGLLRPRREGQHRLYSRADHGRLQLILRGKRAGLSLEESRDIIDMYDPRGSNIEQYEALLAKLDERQAQFQAQIADIHELMEGLEEARSLCKSALNNINRGKSAATA